MSISAKKVSTERIEHAGVTPTFRADFKVCCNCAGHTWNTKLCHTLHLGLQTTLSDEKMDGRKAHHTPFSTMFKGGFFLQTCNSATSTMKQICFQRNIINASSVRVTTKQWNLCRFEEHFHCLWAEYSTWPGMNVLSISQSIGNAGGDSG